MASRSHLLLSFAFALSLYPAFTCADTLKITSTPPGASVEIDGVMVGTTPYKAEVPVGYFHKTRTALARRLQHSMIATISLPCYTHKHIPMTECPLDLQSLHSHTNPSSFC